MANTNKKPRDTRNQNQRIVRRPQPGRPAVDPLTGQVNAATRLSYGPQEAALGQQLRDNQQLQRNVGDWYGEYQRAIGNAETQAAQAYQQAGTQIQQAGAGTAAADQAGRAQMLAQMQADAARRGATVDPSVISNGVNAANVRAVNNTAFGNLNTTLGANASAYGARLGAAAVGQGVVARTGVAHQRQDLLRQGRNLKAEEGAFKVKTKNDLIAAAQNAAINQASVASLEQSRQSTASYDRALVTLKIAALRQSGQNAAADRLLKQQQAQDQRAYRQAQIGLGNTRNSIAQQNANANTYRATHPKTSTPKKPKARQSDYDNLDYAINTLKRYRGKKYTKGSRKGRTITLEEIRQALVGGDGLKRVPPIIATAAYEIVHRNGISQGTLRRLRQRGLTPISRGYPGPGKRTGRVAGGVQDVAGTAGQAIGNLFG